jgi:hypothetical protein
MARLIVALVVLGLATAFGLPSISDLSYNPTLPNTGSLLPTLTSDAAKYSLGYHRIWVPTNIQTFSLEVVSTGTDACSLSVYSSARAFGCGAEWSAESGVTYPCQDVNTMYPYSTSASRDYFPTSYSEDVYFQIGAWFYVSVGRYYPSSEYDQTCLYTLEVTATFCAEGEVASTNTGSTSTCYTPNTIATLPVTANVAVNGWTFHKMWIDAAREFTFFINSTTDYYFYGSSYTAPSDNMYIFYTTGSYASSSDTYMSMGSFPVQKGWFYVAFYQYGSTAGTADIMFDAPACPAGYAGEGCMFPVHNVTGVALANMAGGVNPATASVDQLTFYVVSFLNGTDGQYNFTVTSVAGNPGSFYIYYKRNGYPIDNSNVYGDSSNYQLVSATAGDSQTFSLLWQSLYAGGDFWIGAENTYTTASVNYTLSAATAISSTTAETTDATTTTGGSGAANVVASFALVAFLLALLF